jgi:archaellum component FlaC
MTADQDITPAILLQHMQGMEKRLHAEIYPMKSDLTIIKECLGHVEEHLEHVDKRLKHIDKRLEHVEQDTFLLVNRSQPVQERLDMIEKDQLPKMRK